MMGDDKKHLYENNKKMIFGLADLDYYGHDKNEEDFFRLYILKKAGAVIAILLLTLITLIYLL